MVSRGVLFVISGTGGAGKGTIVERIRADHKDLWWSVSWATRPARDGEREGEHYSFRGRDEFIALRDADGFLEWADVYGVLKGTPRAPLEAALARGENALLEMDIQGALHLQQSYPNAQIVFVVAPSATVQAERLRARGTDDEEGIQRRLDEAAQEQRAAVAGGFHIVTNDDIDRAVAEVAAIIEGS